MERREFFRKFFERMLWVFSGVLLSYPVFTFLSFKRASTRHVVFKKGKGIQDIVFKDRVFLVPAEGKLLALSARCTHLGCTVTYDPLSSEFRCPCHGSRFDRSGKRVAGPARKSLQELPMKREKNGDVVVTITL